jgi:hypothetical protein
MNTSTIVCIIVAVILVAIIIRLATNEGKLMETYRFNDNSDPCPMCRKRYDYCKTTSKNDPRYDCKRIAIAGRNCESCGL